MSDFEQLNKNIMLLNKNIITLVNNTQKNLDVSYTFGRWLDEWYLQEKKPKLKSSTLRMYKYYIYDVIIPKLGNLPFSAYDNMDMKIQTFLDGIELANTRKKISMIISASLNKAVKRRLLPSSPFKYVEVKGYKSKHYLPLQFIEQTKILETMKNDLYISIFWVLCCTGLRIGEFLALNFKTDINYDEKYIIVSKSFDSINKIDGIPKTISSVRQVIFLDLLVPHLKFIAFYQQRCGLTYSMIRCYLKRIYEKLKYKGLNIHSLRHTFVSLCYFVGIREKYIQNLVGHSDISVTLNIYTHILKKGKSPLLDYFLLLKEVL